MFHAIEWAVGLLGVLVVGGSALWLLMHRMDVAHPKDCYHTVCVYARLLREKKARG